MRRFDVIPLCGNKKASFFACEAQLVRCLACNGAMNASRMSKSVLIGPSEIQHKS
jgi:hypothetical protein